MARAQVLNKQAAAEPSTDENVEPEPTEEEKKKAEEKKIQDGKSDQQKAKEWFAGGDKDKENQRKEDK